MVAAAHTDPVHLADPAAALRDRLADPVTAAALHRLLDHADLLAVLVVGLDAMVGRGETISDNLADGLGELRQLRPGGVALPPAGEVARLVQRLTTLTGPLLTALPAIERLMTSDLADPDVIDTASMASRAILAGSAAAAADPPRVTGALALLRALKDPDVSRALGFVLAIAKEFGAELQRGGRPTGEPPPTDPTGG